jgi:hypothetical protein
MGWITWLGVVTVLTILEFIVAQVIPFFNDLLSLISSLFISGFTFYFPAIMWFMFIRGDETSMRKKIVFGVLNVCILFVGLIVLGTGTYSSVVDIVSLIKHLLHCSACANTYHE